MDDGLALVPPGIAPSKFAHLDQESSSPEAPTSPLSWLPCCDPMIRFVEGADPLSVGNVGWVQVAKNTAAVPRDEASDHTAAACLFAIFLIAGEVEIDRNGETCLVRAGDLILHARPLPALLRTAQAASYEGLTLIIRKNAFASTDELEQAFGAGVTVVRGSTLFQPLSTTLAFLAENIAQLRRVEICALFRASVSLLPAAINYQNWEERERNSKGKAWHVRTALLDFVNKHLPNTDLSPQVAAMNLGISVRYVHKLFATMKTTFMSYVTSKRLELVHDKIILASGSSLSIRALAFSCGFNDVSGFNRSFKRRYGVSPTRLRRMRSPAQSPHQSSTD